MKENESLFVFFRIMQNMNHSLLNEASEASGFLAKLRLKPTSWWPKYPIAARPINARGGKRSDAGCWILDSG